MMNHDTMLLHLYVETGMSSHILCTSFIFNYRQCMLVYYTYANECGGNITNLVYVCIQFGNYIFRMIHYALFN